MDTNYTDINKRLEEVNKKLDDLIKLIKENQEVNSSIETKLKQWVIFYIASNIADITLSKNK